MNHPAHPAPPKWAMEAAREYASLQGAVPPDDILQCATIIIRHHAAAQAETVALLEDVANVMQISANIQDMNRGHHLVTADLAVGLKRVLPLIRRHLAQLKEGAT